MTLMATAKRGIITEEMKAVAEAENQLAEAICRRLAKGSLVIPRNLNRTNVKSVGIGEGLRTKVNANIGTSTDLIDFKKELEKAKVAVEAGADTIMDLSVGGDLDEIRRLILKETSVPVGTVPIYQAAVGAIQKKGAIVHMSEDDVFNAIEKHAKAGVDFITVHCGVTERSLGELLKQGRVLDIVSRGGSFHAAWILHNKKENPLYSNFDYLLELAQEYELTLSLGDGMRPGCIADAMDRPMIEETIILGELVDRAREKNVQTIVEGPGHVPLNQVEASVLSAKKLSKNAPLYLLGPVVTDIAPGYDHIVSAIGAAVASAAGADFICYVTPAEHLALPDIKDVREGVIASRIAAHIGDIVKGIGAEYDLAMAKARKAQDWSKQIELAINSKRAQGYREKCLPKNPRVCTMCGDVCAIKIIKENLRKC